MTIPTFTDWLEKKSPITEGKGSCKCSCKNCKSGNCADCTCDDCKCSGCNC